MGKPAARITDMHVCPMVNPGPVPHVGGPVAMGSPNVLTGKLPQARVGDMAVCNGPPDVIAVGSTGVFVNKKPAARLGDQTAHGGTIVAGLPTVLIGETKAGGGGGAGAMFAGANMFQFAEYAAQVQVLIDAYRSGAPFCEICFKNAVAKLKTPAASPVAKAPAAPASAPSAPATPPPAAGPTIRPSNLTCEAVSLKLSCSHGRTSGAENILCVVPGGMLWSDKVTGNLAMQGGCGSHPAWTVSGHASSSGKNARPTFEASALARKPSVGLGSDHASYTVSGEGCGGGVPSITVLAYPPEELSVSIDFMKAIESIKDTFTRTGAAFGGKGEKEFQFLHGSIGFSSKWTEADKDWRCYNERKVSGGFSPLFSGEGKLPFYKPVPPPLSKVVDLQAYFTLKGSCQIQASMTWQYWPYPQPGRKETIWKANVAEGGGEFRLGIGAAASVGEEISITIEGTIGASITIEPAHKDYPAADVKWVVGDGKFDVAVEWPWAIELKYSATLWPGYTDGNEWRFDEVKN